MYKATMTVEFLTPCLSAANFDDDGRDRFLRDGRDCLIWKQAWWYAALAQAIPAADLDENANVSPKDFRFDLEVCADELEFFPRQYDKTQTRVHEAIPRGSNVTFRFMVGQGVSEDDVAEIMSVLGKYIGMTPYGYNLGYGKFNVTELTF